MNPSRVTLADIDTDYGRSDRDKVKEFLLRDKMNLKNINSAEIITFNTIALKGSVRDVCRGLFRENVDSMPTYERDELNKLLKNKLSKIPKELTDSYKKHSIHKYVPFGYLKFADEISKDLDTNEDELRKKYPELFYLVDIVTGTIVSIGTHPSGVIISDLPIEKDIGLCSISTSEYPVSMINMKELDALKFVKIDALGLDNISIITEACKSIGIERLSPDNADLNDEKVWESIVNDTTMIFQWESGSAQEYLKRFMSPETLSIAREKVPNFSMIKWLSFGNGLLRPACASFRDNVARGEFYDNGFDELNTFLAPEAGRIAMQETIMRFLVQFCGYNDAESDNVRRAIAKKKGTETLIPEIKRRFVEYSSTHYNITKERCEEVIEPFIQIILDASAYGFSWNHSDAYSMIGYISGYLRYYYPYEFITAALNTFDDDTEKTASITKYATKNGISIVPPKWGISKGKYYYDKNKKVIAKGLKSVKFLNESSSDELFKLSGSLKSFNCFTDVLQVLNDTGINSRQLDVLISIDFFSEFGNQNELNTINKYYSELFNKGMAKQISKGKCDDNNIEELIQKYSVGFTKSGAVAKKYTVLDMDSLLHDVDDYIMGLGLEDLSISTRVKSFAENMGYVGYVSGKEEDRKKLYVLNIYPIKRKADGKLLGYSYITKSIGSGIESRFTVSKHLATDKPVKKGNIIKCLRWHKESIYFHLDNYEIIE